MTVAAGNADATDREDTGEVSRASPFAPVGSRAIGDTTGQPRRAVRTQCVPPSGIGMIDTVAGLALRARPPYSATSPAPSSGASIE